MASCHSYVYFDIFLYIHTFHTIHSSVATRRGSSPSPHRWSAQWEKHPWVAEPGIELGPALQQADAQQSELRTLTELRRADNYLSSPAPANKHLAKKNSLFEKGRKNLFFYLGYTGAVGEYSSVLLHGLRDVGLLGARVTARETSYFFFFTLRKF